MHTIPLLSWDAIHVGAVAWTDDRDPVACDVPHGLELRVEAATVGESVLIADRPWEQTLGWGQVMFDGGRYRLWYGSRTGVVDQPEVLCYAESADGRTWTKPDLGLVEFEGSKTNNIVYSGNGAVHFCVVCCPHETPDKRYRCMLFKSWWEGADGEELNEDEGLRRLDLKNAAESDDDAEPVTLLGKMVGMNSPDGLRWTPLAKPILDEWHDTHNICVYDKVEGLYRAYFRGFYCGRRAIAYSETRDFEAWPPSRVIHHNLPADRPDESLYSIAYTRYPGREDIHLWFPAIYQQGTDTTYGQLAVSMDGMNWSRLTRQVCIALDPDPERSEATLYPEPELLRFGEESCFRMLCRAGQ